MERFLPDGCMSDEGLQALIDGNLDELGRLEAAEHLSYCDRCMDRYTLLLTEDALQKPPHGTYRTVMEDVWGSLMQNTWGRAAVAGVAAVLALMMWRTDVLGQITSYRLPVWTPTIVQTQQTSSRLGRQAKISQPLQLDDEINRLGEAVRSALFKKDGADRTEK